jgi:uncharacterized protein (TIGR02284 family)
MTTAHSTLDTLNSLLGGELAATETYQQALEEFGKEPGADYLRQMHAEHRDAANRLRLAVRRHGGTPVHDSGAWGSFAMAVEGAAKLFGNAAALKALKEGEEHGVREYRKALEDNDLPVDCRNLIVGTLLPQTELHVSTLDGLLEAL